jgi:hypothetical protein
MANGLANSLKIVQIVSTLVAPCAHFGLTVGISSEIGSINIEL